MTARYSKAKAKDYTDPRHHHTKARGGPITRILPNKNPESASNQD